MTVSSQTSTATFVGNGVATAFPLPFRFFDNGDIRAYFIDSVTGAATQMVLGTDYTLIGAGEPEVDGNALSLLTTTAPLASMRGLYVERVMQQVQETDIVNQGQFFASTHEDVFDRLTMLIQQSNSNSQGAIRVAIGDPEPTRLVPAVSRANMLLGFDSSGNPIAVAPVSGSASELAIDLANSSDINKGASLVGYKGSTVSDELNKLNSTQFAALSVSGTANAITAVFNPIPAFPENGRVLLVKAAISATSSSPTFTPNSGVIGPRIIVKGGNLPLTVGDIPSGYTMLLSYDSAFDRYVLLNPATPASSVVTSINGGEVNGNGNPIVNGAFDVWQLGTDFTLGPHLQKNADRWNYDFNGTVGTAFINKTLVQPFYWTAGFNPKYYLRFRQTVQGSGNTFQDVSTQIEGVSTYAGQKVTISFWAMNLLPTPTAFTAIKTEQYFGSGGSPSAPVFNTSAQVLLDAPQGIWRRESVTFDMASIANKTLGTNGDDTLNVIFTMPLNTVCDIGITCVQIEPGTIATPYQYRPKAKTLQECQRYLRTTYNEGFTPGAINSAGAVAFTAAVNGTNLFTLQLPEPMRGNPAIAFYNPATGAAGTWNMSGTPVSVTVNTLGEKNITVAVVGCTAGAFVIGHYVAQDPLI